MSPDTGEKGLVPAIPIVFENTIDLREKIFELRVSAFQEPYLPGLIMCDVCCTCDLLQALTSKIQGIGLDFFLHNLACLPASWCVSV